MCHLLWRWHRQERSFITTCLWGPVQLAHVSTWVMWLSWVPDSGKIIIILQCHIFPLSSAVELKSNRKFSSSENHIFVILSLVSCCLYQSSQIRDMPSMGASSGFHLLPYRCKTWGAFTGKPEEWVCGGKDGACKMVLKMESKDSGCYPWVTWQGLSSLIADEHMIWLLLGKLQLQDNGLKCFTGVDSFLLTFFFTFNSKTFLGFFFNSLVWPYGFMQQTR